MCAALKTLGNESDINSPETVVTDWFTFIRVTGLQVAKHAQQTKSKIDMHKYPSGKWITKVFLPTDWIFYEKTTEPSENTHQEDYNSPGENQSNFQDSEE